MECIYFGFSVYGGTRETEPLEDALGMSMNVAGATAPPRRV